MSKTTFLYSNFSPPPGNVLGISFCSGLVLSKENYFLKDVTFSAIVVIPATNTLRSLTGMSGEIIFPPTMPLVAPDSINLDPNTVVNTFQLIQYVNGTDIAPLLIKVNEVINPTVEIALGITLWVPGLVATDQVFARAVLEWEQIPK